MESKCFVGDQGKDFPLLPWKSNILWFGNSGLRLQALEMDFFKKFSPFKDPAGDKLDHTRNC